MTCKHAVIGWCTCATGMVLGAVLGYKVLHSWLGCEGGKLAACLCASYVGGSVNFAAVAKVRVVTVCWLPSMYIPWGVIWHARHSPEDVVRVDRNNRMHTCLPDMKPHSRVIECNVCLCLSTAI